MAKRKLSQPERAVKIVMKYEKKRTGMMPKEMPNGYGYDVKSKDRLIEVKSMGKNINKPVWISIYRGLIKNIWKFANEYYIYFVYNMKDTPKMKIITPNKIFPNLKIEPKYVLDGKFITDKTIEEIDVSKYDK